MSSQERMWFGEALDCQPDSGADGLARALVRVAGLPGLSAQAQRGGELRREEVSFIRRRLRSPPVGHGLRVGELRLQLDQARAVRGSGRSVEDVTEIR